MSDSDRPFAAHLQGVGIGLFIGSWWPLYTSGAMTVLPMSFAGAVFLTLGYVVEKRSLNTDSDRGDR